MSRGGLVAEALQVELGASEPWPKDVQFSTLRSRAGLTFRQCELFSRPSISAHGKPRFYD